MHRVQVDTSIRLLSYFQSQEKSHKDRYHFIHSFITNYQRPLLSSMLLSVQLGRWLSLLAASSYLWSWLKIKYGHSYCFIYKTGRTHVSKQFINLSLSLPKKTYVNNWPI